MPGEDTNNVRDRSGAESSAIEAESSATANESPAIVVDGIRKTFLMPQHKVHTLKETILHPLRKYSIDRIPVLKEISFSVAEGEFFGIIGRNGSGKSTLLKCLAGIYKTESGAIGINGRLSPFIELGVGFNPDLNAKDNVYVNAALLGITPRQASRRFDDIIAFAELEEYVDLKFKNYSSGMQVRLGFASAIQVDADILLVDEVLAVGDTNFQLKCYDTFRRLKREGKTIVFVSHDMDSILRFCDRVLYIESGQTREVGEPEQVISNYLEDTAKRQGEREAKERTERRQWVAQTPAPVDGTQIVRVWVCDRAGEESSVITQGSHMYIKTVLHIDDSVENPELRVSIHGDDNHRALLFGARSVMEDLIAARSGPTVQVDMHIHCLLTNGRYHISLTLEQDGKMLDDQRYVETFSVQGGLDKNGTVVLPHKFEGKNLDAATTHAS